MAKAPPPEPTDVRLIELAADHLRRYGVGRTTVVSIAQAAGMSHANVYRYFPSKAALLDAVTDAWLRPIEKGLKDIADGPDPARDKLERLASAIHRAYRRKLDEDPALFGVFASVASRQGPIVRRHRGRILGTIRRVMEEGVSSGAFLLEDLRPAIALFVDALARFLIPDQLLLDRDSSAVEMEARMERVTQVVLRAITTGRIGP